MSLISDIKKNIGLVSKTSMQRTGMIDRTGDKVFDEEYNQYRMMEQNMYELLKDSRRLNDAVHTLNTVQESMSTILQYLAKDAAAASAPDTRAFEMELARTLYDPLVRFVDYFAVIDRAVQERQHQLLKYDLQREKVRRLQAAAATTATNNEEPGNGTLLQSAKQASDERHDLYDALNQTLIRDLQKFTRLCEPYLNPSLEALCQSEYRWVRQQYDYFTTRVHVASDPQDVNDLLDRMRKLSVCSHIIPTG